MALSAATEPSPELMDHNAFLVPYLPLPALESMDTCL